MAITLKRQLNDHEKERVIDQHGRECFATGHTIPDGESIHFDHIRAFASGGPSEINNIAPMCPQHNRDKGTLPLFDFRAKLELQKFFNMGDRLTLGDLLMYLRSENRISEYGLPLFVRMDNGSIRLESSKLSRCYEAHQCPITGWNYFYATLPVELIDSDDGRDSAIGLQPRYLIFDKLFELFRHFQTRPVLQPSLGRIVNDRIKLFDGQHKAAAILWNGHTEFECKIYVDPDIRSLNQANISAHDKFSQTRFYSSIMVLKLGSQFEVDFEAYKNLENSQVKSEAGFVEYLRDKDSLTRGEVAERFRSFLFNSILEDKTNRLARLVSTSNYPTDEKPITVHALRNSLLASFLYRWPVDDDMATESYKRGDEVGNVVKLMNMLDDLALQQWNAKAPANDALQLKLKRLVRSRFMKAWSELLKDAVCARLKIFDQDEKTMAFYREFGAEELGDIEFAVRLLVDWKIWSSPASSEIDQIRLDNDKQVKDWLKGQGLTIEYLLGVS